MTVNDQKASPDIRFPDISRIKKPTNLKSALEAIDELIQTWEVFRHEYEAHYRENWRDQNNVYKVEFPAVAAGAGADFDIPLLTDVVFTLSGSTGIQWTAGTVRFGGTTFTISSGNVDPATSVYIDVSTLSEPTTLGTLNGTAVIVKDRWYVSNRDGSIVHTVLQSPIMHAGLLQANTITADQILAGSITATELSASYLIIGNNHSGTTSGSNNGNHAGTIQGTSGATVVSGAASGATANQDATSTILAGNLTGTVSGVTIITGGKIGTDLVVAASIVAGTITGDRLVGNTVTATQIDVNDLFAESITIQAGGHIKMGQTGYDTGTGFYLGDDSGTPKLSIGVASGNRITWDGSTLDVTTDAGFLGSATNYFDVTNGELFLYDGDFFTRVDVNGIEIGVDNAPVSATSISTDFSDPHLYLNFDYNTTHTFIGRIGFTRDNGAPYAIITPTTSGNADASGFDIASSTIESTTSITSATSLPTVTVAKGGTNLTSAGTSGNVLTSNGSAWTSSAPASTAKYEHISYTGTGVSGKTVSFSFDPDYIIIKREQDAGGPAVWFFQATGSAAYTARSDVGVDFGGVTSLTGSTLTLSTTNAAVNANTEDYHAIAFA